MILLLGATGLLGQNLLKMLLQKGLRVRAVVREGSVIDPEVLAEGPLDVIQGSILNDAVLERAVTGCDSIINCAGVTDMSLTRPEDYRPINTDLPLKLARLLDEGSGGVLVDVSSANTICPGTADAPANEDSPFGGPFAASLYARSKRDSEKLLLDFASTHRRTRIAILMPGFMIGPYDRKPSSGKLLDAGWRKPVMPVPPGGKSFIDARDVAAAAIGALGNPLAEGRYLTTGKSLSLKEFYELQARVCGYRQMYIPLPRKLCLGVGSVGDRIEKSGRRISATTRNIRQLLIEECYDDSRARKELGMPATPLEQSIKDYFDYAARR
ncbi:MAG: NAD-dependent epimerase/dehydratase family protein [Bacteroidales bacterium]|nr:NAD-dependent epimerase/dehydratase family protein [Bacteroidales bacterium]